MKRSKNIQLLALGIVAAAVLSGCGPNLNEQKNCVDENGTVLPDSACASVNGAVPGGHYWYYGGGRLFSPGMRVSGGSRTPIVGRSYFSSSSPHFSTPSSVSRGGFGSSAKSGGGFSVGS